MFERPKRSPVGIKAQSVSSLTRLIAVDVLLKEAKYQPVLNRIASLMSLEKPRFGVLCTALFRQLLAYCEALPESSGRYYTERGGVFEYALQRTEAALSLFMSHTLVEEGKDLSDEQQCWQYALFSAAMLYGIGKLYLDYHIALHDAHGGYLTDWNPLLGDLVSQGEYYQCKILHEPQVEFRSRVNILLAHLIMPKEGFEWIASHPAIFEVWLALLQEDTQGARVLGAILEHAEARALQHAIEDMLLRQEKSTKTRSFGAFERGEKVSVKDLAHQAGAEFIQWMKEKLERGELIFNKTPLTLVSTGVVMGDEVFKWFVREHPEYKNWQAVRQGFLSLGLHDVNGAKDQVSFSRFGVALPEKVQFFNSQTQHTAWVSATALLHFALHGSRLAGGESTEQAMTLNQLNAKGSWQNEATADSFLNPGQSRR